MAHTAPWPPTGVVVEGGRAAVRAGAIPWYVWCFLAANVSAVIGGSWDIAWHKSIGRDSFWTPAHMLIYLCGVLAGAGSAWLILATTFHRGSPLRQASVRMWGFRGPTGAFLGAWGCVAMLASAPFDDWWHNAYGLDVKILSPPHVVLILGIMIIRLGGLVLTLGEMNRAEGALKSKLEAVFLFMGAFWLGGAMGTFMEKTTRNLMHSAQFYVIVAIVAPLFFAAVSHASQKRWTATKMAGIVTVINIGFVWIFPLFPAEPLLGPVYHRTGHYVPPADFPLLILPAAVVFDLVRRRVPQLGLWWRAMVLGPAFLAAFVAVQWPFANFLISDAARNWVFGTHYIPFFVPPESDYVRGVFTVVEQSRAEFWGKMALAFGVAVASVRVGLGWGVWMRRLRR